MTTSTQWYLDSIERELADLPDDERAELLEDLAAHFSEFESDDDLVATLGDPVAYARELRDAAGLSASPFIEAHVSLVDRLRANFDALRRSAAWRAVAAFLPELHPAWWVLRGWLIVAALAGGIDLPIPRVADNTLIGVAALLLIVPVSVKLGGQARLGQRKGLNVALTVFGALFCLILPASASDDSGPSTWMNAVASTAPGPSTIAGRGQSTSPGIWVYDAAGNAYSVMRIYTTPSGQTELHALCPSYVINTSGRTQRSVNGDPIVCIGPLTADASPSTAPATTAMTTTATTRTVAPATTVPASTVPASTVAESTR